MTTSGCDSIGTWLLAWMLPNGTEFFAGDLSEEDQKLVWATHYAPVFDLVLYGLAGVRGDRCHVHQADHALIDAAAVIVAPP